MIDAEVVLEAAYLVYTPGQHDQFYRPLTDVADGDTIGRVLAATDGGRNITPVSLNNVAARIIVPSHTRTKFPLDIPGSMRNGRFAFTLSLLITSRGAHGTMIQEREIIRGFTNHAELSRNNHIPDDMEFYINSRVMVKIGKPASSVASKETRVVHFNHSLLGKNNRLNNSCAMRPEDAVGYAQSAQMRVSGRTVADNRSKLDGITKVADRKHTIPSKWLASTLLGYKRGMNVNSDPEYYDDNGDYAQIVGKVITVSITNSHFYNAMVQGRPISSDDDNMFTFREIDTVFPLHNDKWIKIIKNRKNDIDLINETDDWAGAQTETNVAYNLTHILPATMNQLLLTRLEVIIANDHRGGELHIDVLDYRKMFDDDGDDESYTDDVEYIMDQIDLDVVQGLLESNGVGRFNIHINANLTWNSIFKIQLEGDRIHRYSAPMFCDGYYSPLIDPESENVISISETVDHLAVSLVEATREKRTAFSDFFDMANGKKALSAPPKRESRQEGNRRIVTVTSSRRR